MSRTSGRQLWAIPAAALALAAALACASVVQAQQTAAAAQTPAAQAAAPAPGVPMKATERVRLQALDDEKNVRLADALLRWKILLGLDPKNTEAAARIPVIEEQIRVLAESHYQHGLALLKKKQREDALREFLLALNYNPDHADALDSVRNKLKPADWVFYTTVPGDTLQVVAKKAYQDEKKTFLVWSYNDLTPTTKFEPGTVLKLPIIESDLRRPSVNVQDVLRNAKAKLDQGEFDEAVAAAEGILIYDAGNAMARELINNAYHRQGKDFVTQNKPYEALVAFRNVEPNYKDTKESMAALQTSLKAGAEEHYKKGVEFFIKENLDGAITEWELTIRMDPAHPKAQQDLDNARQLRDRLQQVQR